MLRAMAKAMLPPTVTAPCAPPSLLISLPAPAQTVASPSNIDSLPAVGAETIPTVPPVNDCSVIESIPLATTNPTAEHVPPPELATPQPISKQQIAPAFSAQSCSPSTLAWYLIHTKPRQEALALTNLSRQGFECYIPMLRRQKIQQRKTALVSEPMFPRYLFIRLGHQWLRPKLVTDSVYVGCEPVGSFWWPASQGGR